MLNKFILLKKLPKWVFILIWQKSYKFFVPLPKVEMHPQTNLNANDSFGRLFAEDLHGERGGGSEGGAVGILFIIVMSFGSKD